MKTYYLKIREKFISEIIAGNKKHEYRLCTPERIQIKVGDTLVLISNQDKRNYVKVTVKAQNIYKNWDAALKENWQQDFQRLFPSLEEAIRECHKFYTKDEVDQYGIIAFDIEPIKINYIKESVLLDTNIVIKRESGNNVSYEVAKLFNWFSKKAIPTYVHSLTKDEIADHKDADTRKAMLLKLSSYNCLPEFRHHECQYFTNVISKYSQDKNGKVDNALLREVYENNIGLLLTDDKLILQKATDLYIRDRVITSAEFLSYFETMCPQNVEYKMLSVKLKNLNEVNLHSSFFDTLREDYGGIDFDNWFKKKALKGEKAYVFEDADGLKGFLYLKSEDAGEDYSDIEPQFAPKKRLKVGTFKIERTGFRLGERFLKIIFDNARRQDVDEIYVTLFEDKREGVAQLKNLMEQWGFRKYGHKKNGEAVLVKSMREYDESRRPKFNFPLTRKSAKCYFLPIYPEYHTDLFPDMILNNEDMHLYEENKAHRYALEKIYLSGAYNLRGAKAGDKVLIYRIGERYPKKYSSVVTGVAIIEDIIITKTVEECIGICKNRSIFSEDKIKRLHSSYPTVIKLLDFAPFKNKVTLNRLYELEIIAQDSGPRPFGDLTAEQFETIYKIGMEEQE